MYPTTNIVSPIIANGILVQGDYISHNFNTATIAERATTIIGNGIVGCGDRPTPK
jgi:hypothetical protein